MELLTSPQFEYHSTLTLRHFQKSKISFPIIPAPPVIFELLFQALMLNQHSSIQEKVSVNKHVILKVMKILLSGKEFFKTLRLFQMPSLIYPPKVVTVCFNISPVNKTQRDVCKRNKVTHCKRLTNMHLHMGFSPIVTISTPSSMEAAACFATCQNTWPEICEWNM